MDAMETIRQTFFQECADQLSEMESGLLAMSEGAADSETINAVFRAVHSIKGGAGAFKLEALVQFAHKFETALDHIRSGKLTPTPDVMKVLLRAADILSDLVDASREGTEILPESWTASADELLALTSSPDGTQEEDDFANIDFQPSVIDFGDIGSDFSVPEEPQHIFEIKFRPKPELYTNANETLLVIRELGRLGAMEICCDTSDVPLLDLVEPAGAYFNWSIKLTTQENADAVSSVFEFVDTDAELEIKSSGANAFSDVDIAALLVSVTADACTLGSIEAIGVQEIASNEPGVEKPSTTAEAVSNAATLSAPAPVAEAAKLEVKQGSASTAPLATIRVEFDRVDRLINLVGELVINQAMLSQRVAESNVSGSSPIAVGLDELEQLTREIQEGVMGISAQPVKPLFQRMTRIVREVAEATGKEVKFKTDGDATEVDKTVIERLADPLTHMIRNAVDHGLETPAARIAAGKPAEGVVRLTAAHRSGRIVLEVSDDGAGINRPKVRESAIKKGLISADVPLSDSEIDNLLFLPGFSTANAVSNISGRGVGMDVVKRSIQALGGRISITSRPGKGSTFSLSLPLTLAVLDGMVVSVNGQTLVVPLTAIVETLKPKAADVHALGSDGRVMAIRNTFVPLIDVGVQLGFRKNPLESSKGVAILIETENGSRSALLVDTIQDQRQVVIKSLETNYGTVEGIAAATILGDGRVALILDIDAVVKTTATDAVVSELRYGTGG